MFITQEQLGRFDKALRFEIAKREELKKSLAAGKTHDEYAACSTTVAMSNEMQQIIKKWSEMAANTPPDQMAKAGEKMQADVAALATKHCGVDPSEADRGRADRIRAIENEASVVAMPPGWTPPAGTQGPRAYAMFKERIPVFCGKVEAKAALTPTPVQIGGEKVMVVKITGSGAGVRVPAGRSGSIDPGLLGRDDPDELSLRYAVNAIVLSLIVALSATWQVVSPGVWQADLPMASSGALAPVRAIVIRLDPSGLRFKLDHASRDHGMIGTWTVDRMPADGVVAFNAGQFSGGDSWGWLVRDGVESQPPGSGSLGMSFVVDHAGKVSLVTPGRIARYSSDCRPCVSVVPDVARGRASAVGTPGPCARRRSRSSRFAARGGDHAGWIDCGRDHTVWRGRTHRRNRAVGTHRSGDGGVHEIAGMPPRDAARWRSLEPARRARPRWIIAVEELASRAAGAHRLPAWRLTPRMRRSPVSGKSSQLS